MTLSRLEDEHLAFIRSFLRAVEVELGPTGRDASQRMLAFHASPRSYDDILLPASGTDALEPFRDAGAGVLAGGHTHTQWTRTIDGALFVNPGSVGLAYDHHQPEHDFKLTPVAEYAVVTCGNGGAAIEFRRVPYSLEALVEVTRASGRPDAEDYAQSWRPFAGRAIHHP